MPQRTVNDAVGGTQLPAMDTRASADVDALPNANNVANVNLIWGGTNDLALGAVSGATAYSRLVTYCGNRRAAGYKVVVLTCLSRSDAAAPSGYNTERATLNGLIRANWATFSDAVADIATDGTIGFDGAELNTTYFQTDKVHLNSTGYGIVSTYVYPALNTLGIT